MGFQSWLYDRAKYLVSEDLKLDETSIKVVQQNYAFPKSILPKIDPMGKRLNQEEVKIAMANIGGGLYMAGKQTSSLWDLRFGRGSCENQKSPCWYISNWEGHFVPLLRNLVG